MLYKFETTMNDKDFYEFNKYTGINSPEAKKRTLISKVYVPFLFSLVLLFYIIRGDDWYFLQFAVVIFSIISVAWFFLLKPFYLLILKLNISIVKKKGKLPYSSVATLEFYDDYFVEKTENTKTEVGYDAVLRVGVNQQKAIYIYQHMTFAYIIPFNVFSSDDERKQFIDFINEKTNKEPSSK